MLESGEAKSMKEIARREGVDDSYVSRMVNLSGMLQHLVPGWCRQHGAGPPIEQSTAQARLERLDAAGKGGLADVQCPGGPRVVAVVSQRDGVAKQANINHA
jgi:hypothetical protein